MINKVLKNKKGVTLLEMVVAIGIFMTAVLSATSIFNFAVEAQRSAVSAQNLQESLRYALEFITKEIRSADKKMDTADCFGFARVYCNKKDDSETIPNPHAITLSRSGVFHRLWLDLATYRIKFEEVSGNTGYITPASIKINDLQFIISDDGVDKLQSKVTMVMEAEAVTNKQANKQKINLQTTISSRYYE